ncbi:MAG: hypothetical protein IJ520_04480 [Synergistaceae bacterium]|nr:hypothetical protein [Synergistaceae bacterium]
MTEAGKLGRDFLVANRKNVSLEIFRTLIGEPYIRLYEVKKTADGKKNFRRIAQLDMEDIFEQISETDACLDWLKEAC